MNPHVPIFPHLFGAARGENFIMVELWSEEDGGGKKDVLARVAAKPSMIGVVHPSPSY